MPGTVMKTLIALATVITVICLGARASADASAATPRKQFQIHNDSFWLGEEKLQLYGGRYG